MRRRAVLFAFLGLAAAFLYAVPRDTFVRRWLVPRPASAAEATLGRPYPGTMPADATLEQMVADLSRHAGGAVAFADRSRLEAVGIDLAGPACWRPGPNTVGGALAEVCLNVSTPTADLGFDARGDAVWVRTDDELPAGHVVRVYDLTDLVRAERARHDAGFVPDPYARPADPGSEEAGGSEAGDPDAPVRPATPATRPYWSPGQRRPAAWSDAQVVAAVVRSVERAAYPNMGRPARPVGGTVRTTGRRLVVADTVMNHRRVVVVIERLRRDGFPPPSFCGN